MQIFSIQDRHVAPITHIYNHYIAHTTATFEETVISPNTMQQRVDNVRQQDLPWLVAVNDEEVCGYAYASPWKARSAYRFSVETTIYMHPDNCAKGYGTTLYRTLLEELKAKGIHRAIGGITLPNPASVQLHEKLGMTNVALFTEVGFKFNQWLDVGYWQFNLADKDT